MDEMKLTVKGLFGHFDYEIPLYGLSDADSFPVSDGVTILTGPNGYGKTTILRILEALGNWREEDDDSFFFDLKFRKLTLREDGQESLSITRDIKSKSEGSRLPNGEVEVEISYDIPDEPDDMTAAAFFQEIGRRLKHMFPNLFMVSEQRLLEIQDVPLMYDGKPLQVSGKPIMTQKVGRAVSGLPAKLKAHFSTAFDNYAEIDSKLNASFPRRVLSQSSDRDLTQEEFDRFYQDMNTKLRASQENGLSEFVQQDIPKFQAGKAGILRVFFDDFNEKYKAYEPLVRKLTLFRKILDRRFRRFKRVEISREYGLRVRDSGGDVIPLEKLSSGEQETLVLYYQLIFETAPGTMLLIDEPEISLHIAWQRHFIDEVKEIVRLNGLRAVVATHSASIIGRHRDIQVDLGALYQDELDRQRAQQG